MWDAISLVLSWVRSSKLESGNKDCGRFTINPSSLKSVYNPTGTIMTLTLLEHNNSEDEIRSSVSSLPSSFENCFPAVIIMTSWYWFWLAVFIWVRLLAASFSAKSILLNLIGNSVLVFSSPSLAGNDLSSYESNRITVRESSPYTTRAALEHSELKFQDWARCWTKLISFWRFCFVTPEE